MVPGRDFSILYWRRNEIQLFLPRNIFGYIVSGVLCRLIEAVLLELCDLLIHAGLVLELICRIRSDAMKLRVRCSRIIAIHICRDIPSNVLEISVVKRGHFHINAIHILNCIWTFDLVYVIVVK